MEIILPNLLLITFVFRITAEEFMNRLSKTGKLIDIHTGKPTVWNKQSLLDEVAYNSYLAKVGVNPHWNPKTCIATFPSERGADAINKLRQAHADIMAEKGGRKRPSLAASVSPCAH